MLKFVFIFILSVSSVANAFVQGSCDGANDLIPQSFSKPTKNSLCFYGSSNDDRMEFSTTKLFGGSYRVVTLSLALNNEKHSFTLYDTGPRVFWENPEKCAGAIFWIDRIFIFGFDGKDQINAANLGLKSDWKQSDCPFEIVVITSDGEDAIYPSPVYKTKTYNP